MGSMARSGKEKARLGCNKDSSIEYKIEYSE
jgi:hypothetical protein